MIFLVSSSSEESQDGNGCVVGFTKAQADLSVLSQPPVDISGLVCFEVLLETIDFWIFRLQSTTIQQFTPPIRTQIECIA